MARQPCCDKVGLKKGPWTAEEDKKLINFILTNGQCCWRAVPKLAGLLRCGKSCRLRWTNYLRPDLKRGLLSDSEEKLVIDLHSKIGNRWSKIAAQLPGRTDNEIKNHWNTHIKKKLKKMGIDPNTHKPIVNNSSVKEEEQQQSEKVQVEFTEVYHSNSSNKNLGMDHLLGNSSGFCIEDVPMVQPDEIMVTTTTTASSSLSSTTTSTSSSFSNISSSDSPGEFEFPNMDRFLQESTEELWGMDEDFNSEGLDFNWDNNTINAAADKLFVDPFGQFNNLTGANKNIWKFPF